MALLVCILEKKYRDEIKAFPQNFFLYTYFNNAIRINKTRLVCYTRSFALIFCHLHCDGQMLHHARNDKTSDFKWNKRHPLNHFYKMLTCGLSIKLKNSNRFKVIPKVNTLINWRPSTNRRKAAEQSDKTKRENQQSTQELVDWWDIKFVDCSWWFERFWCD